MESAWRSSEYSASSPHLCPLSAQHQKREVLLSSVLRKRPADLNSLLDSPIFVSATLFIVASIIMLLLPYETRGKAAL
jgi:hypothetical protein